MIPYYDKFQKLSGVHICTLIMLLSISSFSIEKHFRMLVAVTPRAAQQIVQNSISVKDYVKSWAINEVNAGFSKSGTPTLVDLAGIEFVTYQETGNTICDDLDFLKGGYYGLDSLRALRTNYAADIVLMLEQPTDIMKGAGCAYDGAATRDIAFCTCYWDLPHQYFLAGHEIGHIFGCGHDTITQPGNNPYFPYNHGYIAPTCGFGTIMSYYCNTKNFYSNPDSSYTDPGTGIYYPTRGSARCNNNRVINERIDSVMAFYNPQANITITNQLWRANDFGDVLATNSITLNGTDSLKDSSEVWLRATNTVTIASGFFVGNKSSLTIRAGSGALSKKRSFEENRGPQQYSQAIEILKLSLSIARYNKRIEAHYSIPKEENIELKIFNSAGRAIFIRSLGKKIPGSYSEIIPSYLFSRGNFGIIQIQTDTRKKAEKIICFD